MKNPIESITSAPSMNEAGTLNLVKKKGLQPVETFVPHQPLIYVLEEAIRGEDGPLAKDYPKEIRPSLAVINDPIHINFSLPFKDDTRTVYDLKNEGGDVDFYAINPKTGELVFVGRENKDKIYYVRKETLFTGELWD